MSTEAISRLIYGAALQLDEEDFKGFLKKCGPLFSYRICTYSPELGKEMIWLDHDRESMKSLFSMLPKHVRMKGMFKRHVSIYRVDYNDDSQANVLSSVMVVHTDQDGISKLFAVGQYNDVIDVSGEEPQLIERVVRLDTRDLGPGMHVPV
jgi:methanesulfonate monooxygenase small subunit